MIARVVCTDLFIHTLSNNTINKQSTESIFALIMHICLSLYSIYCHVSPQSSKTICVTKRICVVYFKVFEPKIRNLFKNDQLATKFSVIERRV